MTDKDIIINYLSLLKSSVEVYIHGTLESSNKNIKNLLKNTLNNILLMQELTFEMMVKNNFYNVENIGSENIKKVYDKLSNN